jgi:hypothetical protein
MIRIERVEAMTDQANRSTLKRVDSDPIVIVGEKPDAPPAYVDALISAGYEVTLVPRVMAAAIEIAAVMPRVVILSTSVPMPDHRIIHEASIAVTAEVVLLAADADGSAVAEQVDRACARATQRRGG